MLGYRTNTSDPQIELVEIFFVYFRGFLDPDAHEVAGGECYGFDFLYVVETAEYDLVPVELAADFLVAIGMIHLE